MPLTKRKSQPKKKTEASEPETFIQQEPVNVAVKQDSSLGKCVKCRFHQANSLVDKLCHRCHKEANGFEFDGQKRRYIKKGKK